MLMTNSWIHDIFMNGATDYIKQHYQDEKPFFLYLAFTDPVWLFCLYSNHQHAGGWEGIAEVFLSFPV